MIPNIFRKTDIRTTSIILYFDPSFSAEQNTSINSIHLLLTFYPQKVLNLLSLQILGMKLKSP